MINDFYYYSIIKSRKVCIKNQSFLPKLNWPSSRHQKFSRQIWRKTLFVKFDEKENIIVK